MKRLIERAASPNDASKIHLALMVEPCDPYFGQGGFDIVLYDTYELLLLLVDVVKYLHKSARSEGRPGDPKGSYGKSLLRDNELMQTLFDNAKLWLRGCISAYPSKEIGNGVLEIHGPAATGKFGPLLYDIAMSLAPNGIAPDRTGSSPSAMRVWNYYKNVRKDVIAHRIGGEVEYEPDDLDDLLLEPDPPADSPMDYIYTTDSPVNVDSLMHEHKRFLERLKTAGFQKTHAKKIIWKSAEIFFYQQYDLKNPRSH